MQRGSISGTQRAELELQEVLGSAVGRAVLWRIVTLCGVLDPVGTVNGQMQYAEGRRSIGLELMADIERVDPNLVPLMMQEELNRKLATGAMKETRR